MNGRSTRRTVYWLRRRLEKGRRISRSGRCFPACVRSYSPQALHSCEKTRGVDESGARSWSTWGARADGDSMTRTLRFDFHTYNPLAIPAPSPRHRLNNPAIPAEQPFLPSSHNSAIGHRHQRPLGTESADRQAARLREKRPGSQPHIPYPPISSKRTQVEFRVASRTPSNCGCV